MNETDDGNKRDVFGYVVANDVSHVRWSGSAQQSALHEEVAEKGGWGRWLWPTRSIEKLIWYNEEGYYKNLKWATRQSGVLDKQHPAVVRAYEEVESAYREVERDIPRTCPGHVSESSIKRNCEKILHAYVLRNREVGYCQGMNYITALLGRIASEEEAFWLLSNIVEQIVPDYYKGLKGVIVDLAVLELMLQELEPKLWVHLSTLGFSCSAVFTQYLVCLFARGTPAEAVLQLWKAMFNAENPRIVLLRLTASLVMLLKAELLSAETVDDAVSSFLHGTASLYDPSGLVEVANMTKEILTDDWIKRTRRIQSRMMARGSNSSGSSGSSRSAKRDKVDDRLEFIKRSEITRELIEEIRSRWKGSLDGPVSRDELGELMKAAEINSGFAKVFNWGNNGVIPFREILLSLVLLQEGDFSDRFRTAVEMLEEEDCGDSGSENGISKSYPSRVSLALENPPLPSNDDTNEDFGIESPEGAPQPDAVDLSAVEDDEFIKNRPIQIPDIDAIECNVCLKEFKWFRRRHHCRACGQVICSSCSPLKTLIPFLGYNTPVRICLGCECHFPAAITTGDANNSDKSGASLNLQLAVPLSPTSPVPSSNLSEGLCDKSVPT